MDRGRVIGLISGKGGVGKTSLGVNLGIGLSEFGQEVTVVDADFSASNLGVHLGKYEHPVKVQHVLDGNSDPENAIFRHPSGIKAAVSSNEIHHVEPEAGNLAHLLNEAAKNSDYVIVDCPPGLNSTVEKVMESCDELIIITMPTQTSGINAAQIIEKAKQMRQPILGTVINMSEGEPDRELIQREVEMMTESDTIAEIPYDDKVKESLFQNTPLLKHEPLSEASLEIKKLAAALEGVQYEEPRFAGLKRKLNNLTDTLKK